MRRLLFAPLLALGVVGVLAAPAVAKGPIETAKGTVIITGPGLKGPVEVDGTLEGFAEPGEPAFVPLQPDSVGEFGALVTHAGLLGSFGLVDGKNGGWYVPQPKDLRAIGPAYKLRLVMTGDGWSESSTRLLYPFSPERPLVFTPPEAVTQTTAAQVQPHSQGLWWSAPPALLAILQSHGLPKVAPPAAGPPAASAPLHIAQPQGWVVLWTGLAFLGLVIAGVLAGRRRIRMA